MSAQVLQATVAFLCLPLYIVLQLERLAKLCLIFNKNYLPEGRCCSLRPVVLKLSGIDPNQRKNTTVKEEQHTSDNYFLLKIKCYFAFFTACTSFAMQTLQLCKSLMLAAKQCTKVNIRTLLQLGVPVVSVMLCKDFKATTV